MILIAVFIKSILLYLYIVNYYGILMREFKIKRRLQGKMIGNPVPNVGAKLRSLRDQQELSLRALADLSGLSFNAIAR